MKNRRILNILTFPILQIDYSPDKFLIEYRHLPHESLTQDLLSHKKWARLRAKNEIGQISSETENLAILHSNFLFLTNFRKGYFKVLPEKPFFKEKYFSFCIVNSILILKADTETGSYKFLNPLPFIICELKISKMKVVIFKSGLGVSVHENANISGPM